MRKFLGRDTVAKKQLINCIEKHSSSSSPPQENDKSLQRYGFVAEERHWAISMNTPFCCFQYNTISVLASRQLLQAVKMAMSTMSLWPVLLNRRIIYPLK